MRTLLAITAALSLLAACTSQPEAAPVPCDSRSAFDAGNNAFKAAFPGSKMNFPMYNDSLVLVIGDTFISEGWTVVDGRLRYEYRVSMRCVAGALVVGEVHREIIP